MASSKDASSKDASTSVAWTSLVSRSLEAWVELDRPKHPLAESLLQSYTDLDGFLNEFVSPFGAMFWFFQRREAFMSQKTMTKWSRDRLDDYILLPAFPDFVTRDECMFVSHFWHTHDDPDPGGKYVQLMQKDLGVQHWSYIWVDWTCIPQQPRSELEEAYFQRALRTMPAIIRNCGFMWWYPGFQPRLWILYEVAEYTLTCEGAHRELVTEDIKEFLDHVEEMREVGVRATLSKHGYKCTFDRDKEFITSWLELLILLDGLLELRSVRRILDNLTWFPTAGNMWINTLNGQVTLHRFEGKLGLGGEEYTFTPFPQWKDGKYSMSTISVPTETQQPPRRGGSKDEIEEKGM